MINERRNVMRSVKMNKNELLEIVRANKQKHIEQYLESVEDYKAAAINIAKANLKLAKTGDLEKIEKMQDMPSAPTSYESNYSKAIRMLELSVEETIDIEENIFNQLVLDEWSWKHSFHVSNATYKSFI